MKFTIITPSFNNETTILRSIKSLHSQIDTSFEHVVVDNLSKDKTVEICKKFSSKISIKYLSNKNIKD